MRRKIGNIGILIICLIGAVESSFHKDVCDATCKGKRHFNATLAAYYPDYEHDEREDGFRDALGSPLQTLQDYLDGRGTFVTLSMDEQLHIAYGMAACIPELNDHFGQRIFLEVRDSASNLNGLGTSRVDVCVRSEADSYDKSVNRQVTLILP